LGHNFVVDDLFDDAAEGRADTATDPEGNNVDLSDKFSEPRCA
jgi:hypothetical protein